MAANQSTVEGYGLEYRRLSAFFHSELEPPETSDAKLFALNVPNGESLGLTEGWLRSPEGLAVLSGQSVVGGGSALAMAYGGHQFGHWSGLLGDGRARLVGDVPDAEGKRHELHLKGSGITPYSRRGDGKATLGSAIREYIVSEAMAALGVPTTRSLSIVTTGESIVRNGPEPGAILCRTARSHIRVGTFQLAAASGDNANVKALADFAIDRLYPDVATVGPDRYRYFLREVISQQALLVAKWMGLGFIHGVMNTDNVCVSGETIDYGPCAFMDDFHPAKVFSSIDRGGRYAWNKQPEMAHWNLVRLAETLLPLLGENEAGQQAAAQADIDIFPGQFETVFNTVMSNKFGIADKVDGPFFFTSAFQAMTEGQVDFTLFFRNLTLVAKGEPESLVTDLFNDQNLGADWVENWKRAVGFKAGLSCDQVHRMQRANPIIIPRNHRVEQAISDANSGNFDTFKTLLKATSKPFQDRPEFSHFEHPPEDNEVVQQTFCGT